MAKKILIINGHPDSESFGNAIVMAYQKGAVEGGAKVEVLHLREMEFQLDLSMGYRKRTELEPDLLEVQKKITWAEHIVIVYPVWWGSVPALLKGFLDRTLLPGFAFQKRENSLWWDKLLKGRSARIISTLDQPVWYYRWFNGRPTYHAMKKMTLQFTGIKPVKTTTFGPVRGSKEDRRKKWLAKVEQLGLAGR